MASRPPCRRETPKDYEAMTGKIAIFGYGAVGRATAALLLSEGRELIVAQRRAPPDLPKGAAFAPCDALDRDAVVKAARSR